MSSSEANFTLYICISSAEANNTLSLNLSEEQISIYLEGLHEGKFFSPFFFLPEKSNAKYLYLLRSHLLLISFYLKVIHKIQHSLPIAFFHRSQFFFISLSSPETKISHSLSQELYPYELLLQELALGLHRHLHHHSGRSGGPDLLPPCRVCRRHHSR